MRNLSQQFPQTSTRFGHNEIRKPAKASCIIGNWHFAAVHTPLYFHEGPVATYLID